MTKTKTVEQDIENLDPSTIPQSALAFEVEKPTHEHEPKEGLGENA
jgi:hypothetical protein